jgi:ATP-dependent Clp protease ATP-binding subunit ClpA
MFEHFTDGARRAIVWAQEEARELGDAHIGTEHVLLGVLREPDSDGAQLLGRVGVSADDVRAAVLRQRPRTRLRKPSSHMPFTPETKQVLEHAVSESWQRDAARIAPAALVLGLLDLPDCAAVGLLIDVGVDPGELRPLAEQAVDGGHL